MANDIESALPKFPDWGSLGEVRRLEERIEEMEDLKELRAAVERNAGKSGTPWEEIKVHVDLERRAQLGARSARGLAIGNW